MTAYPDSLPSRELLIAAARDTAALIRSHLDEEAHRRVLSLPNEGLTLADGPSPEIGQGADAAFAQHIEIMRSGLRITGIRLNGELLPWFIGPHIRIDLDRTDGPRVTVSLLADRVSIVDEPELGPAGSGAEA